MTTTLLDGLKEHFYASKHSSIVIGVFTIIYCYVTAVIVVAVVNMLIEMINYLLSHQQVALHR